MDIAVLDAIQQHLRTPLLDQIMLLATHLGDLALVWLVAGAVLVAQPRYRRWGVAVLLAVVATAILGMFVLKPLFGRARPFVAYEFAGLLIPPPSGDSFPSNHSMVSFAAAAALCCLPGKGRGVLALKVSAEYRFFDVICPHEPPPLPVPACGAFPLQADPPPV